MIDVPPNLSPAQRLLFLSTCRQGYDCALQPIGVLEQNPYLLGSDLYSAWRSGWFAGVDSMSAAQIQRISKTSPEIRLAQKRLWQQTIERYHQSNQSLVAPK